MRRVSCTILLLVSACATREAPSPQWRAENCTLEKLCHPMEPTYFVCMDKPPTELQLACCGAGPEAFTGLDACDRTGRCFQFASRSCSPYEFDRPWPDAGPRDAGTPRPDSAPRPDLVGTRRDAGPADAGSSWSD
ncbi:MAG: hypothetical protein IT371_31235 [Deltaproteobacteria bacterium]|nr:hypothetical protein [Deltaproteobacteria bacterium]